MKVPAQMLPAVLQGQNWAAQHPLDPAVPHPQQTAVLDCQCWVQGAPLPLLHAPEPLEAPSQSFVPQTEPHL